MKDTITLKDFLKIYTAISNKFIDKYYKFYEMCKKDVFGIEASLVIKYLKLTNSRKFYERLKNTYTLGSDYIIKRLMEQKEKGKQNVFYYVSFDCFERICMLSRSKIGNETRDYFIILRKFVNYYKQNFADGINNLIKNDKCIYIILVNKGKNIFKVGITKNMRKRLYTYSTGKDKHPDILFIMLVHDPRHVEECTKLIAKKHVYKEGKELYKIDFDMLKEIIFECAILQKKINIGNKKNKDSKYDAYIVYDNAKNVEYLNLNGKVIGKEKK